MSDNKKKRIDKGSVPQKPLKAPKDPFKPAKGSALSKLPKDLILPVEGFVLPKPFKGPNKGFVLPKPFKGPNKGFVPPHTPRPPKKMKMP